MLQKLRKRVYLRGKKYIKAAAAIKAEEIMTALEAEAKERQKESGRLYGENHPKEVPQIFGEPLQSNGKHANESTQAAAELFGTNRQYVSKAKLPERS